MKKFKKKRANSLVHLRTCEFGFGSTRLRVLALPDFIQRLKSFYAGLFWFNKSWSIGKKEAYFIRYVRSMKRFPCLVREITYTVTKFGLV